VIAVGQDVVKQTQEVGSSSGSNSASLDSIGSDSASGSGSGNAGKPFVVRYDEVNAMLLNEFLKEHRGVQDLKNTVGKQEAMIAQQQEEIQALTAALKAQAAQIQKVSDRIGAGPPPRVVADN
jgi:hypothetical protein